MIAQFGRFTVVGVLGTALDFALLWAFLRLRVWLPLAVSIAYLAATAAQFAANRHYTFRNFDRAALAQSRTYAVVCALNWLVAVAVVQIGTSIFALSPLVAKACSIPPSAALGFFGNRYLTFGPGVRGRLKRR